jgi:hypothetical protein
MKQIQGKDLAYKKPKICNIQKKKQIIELLRRKLSHKNLIYSRNYSPYTILKGIKP